MAIRNTNTGDVCNNNFADLLNKFDASTNEKEWLALIEEAKLRSPLTNRQTDAIIARCKNSIAGTYGNTKTTVQMSQTKTGFSKAS